MKKYFCRIPRSLLWGILFGVSILIAGVSFAMMVTMTSKADGELLTAEDFNKIPQVLAGIDNINGDVGIGTAAVSGIKLSVGGVLRTRSTATVNCDNQFKGSIYYNATTKHFYICRGDPNGWAQLDNE